MPPPPHPTFSQWRDYCFTTGYADFHTHADDTAARRADVFLNLPSPLLAAYLRTLFDGAAELRDRFTPDQIADATWFVFGVGSCYLGQICSPETPADLRLAVYAAMPKMYTDLYDHLCNRGRATEKLDDAVYMIWDMGGAEIALVREQSAPLVDAAFNVLQTVLDRCSTDACIQSALHALGHAQLDHEARVHRMIDAFLDRRGPTLNQPLLAYARQARQGCVQ